MPSAGWSGRADEAEHPACRGDPDPAPRDRQAPLDGQGSRHINEKTVTAHPKPNVPFKDLSIEERVALLRAVAGKYRDLMRSSHEFVARKREETAVKEAKLLH
jgi:hypothetical protein